MHRFLMGVFLLPKLVTVVLIACFCITTDASQCTILVSKIIENKNQTSFKTIEEAGEQRVR